MCWMVKIMKDKETAQHIDQYDSDLPSETNESFKFLLERNSDEWEWHITSGGEGSDWKEVAYGNDN